MYSWAESQMTRRMVEPGNEEILFNELRRATRKRKVTQAIQDEIARVNSLTHILPEPAQLKDIDDLWEYLRLHVCQITTAQKAHFLSVLTDALTFTAASTFSPRDENEIAPWYQQLQTKGGYAFTIDMPEPNRSSCPEYSNRELAQFQKCHTVFVTNKGCWSEWNMLRKPDDSRGQTLAMDQLYTALMAAQQGPEADQAEMAIHALQAEIIILKDLPEQIRVAADFSDGYDVYRWILNQAHQITAAQKEHVTSILEAGVRSVSQGFASPAADSRACLPSLQSHTLEGHTKYKFEFGKIWMECMDEFLD